MAINYRVAVLALAGALLGTAGPVQAEFSQRVWNPYLSSTTRAGSLATEEAAALERINLRRGQIGLPSVARNSLIDTAARGHSNYLAANNTTGHYQSASKSGFTGVDPGDRISAAGYRWTSYNEVISFGPASGADGIDSLIQAIYHRFGLFSTRASEVGIGMVDHHPYFGFVLTANLASNLSPTPSQSASWIGVYPYDSQSDAPRDFFSDEESPDPIAGHNQVGYPVSLHVDASLTLNVSSFTLQNAAGQTLSGTLLKSASDSHTPDSVAAFIPTATLDYGSTYTARFVGSADSTPIDKTWSFSTAPLASISFCPATPVAGPGVTFNIELSGGSGRFTNVGWSNSRVIDVSFQDSTTLAVTALSPGTATITVTDSDKRQATVAVTVQAGAGTPSSDCGTTTAPLATLSATHFDFDQIEVGQTSASQTLTLRNSGDAALALESVAATGDFRVNNNCSTSLAAGSSCSIGITFAPTATGSSSGTLSIVSNAADSPHQVSLTGTGIVTTTPTQTPASFAAQVSGSTHAQTITLTLTPASTDVGQSRKVFVAAFAGTLLYFNNGTSWLPWDGNIATIPTWTTAPLGTALSVPIFAGVDVRSLCGIDLAIGYGASPTEMVAASRYDIVHRICE